MSQAPQNSNPNSHNALRTLLRRLRHLSAAGAAKLLGLLACTNIKYYYIFVQATLERWTGLYDIAASQSGYFTTAQASEGEFSLQLLEHHLATGRLLRVQRGIYRLTHFPSGEHDDLVVIWLWSQHKGVFSHGTALALHELSDYLPVRYHLTVPLEWKKRRLKVPPQTELHYADLSSQEKRHFSCFLVTSPERTLADCRADGLSPEFMMQAEAQAKQRGLLSRRSR